MSVKLVKYQKFFLFCFSLSDMEGFSEPRFVMSSTNSISAY